MFHILSCPPALRAQARLSLRLPWWSFVDGFAGVRDAAELAGGTAEIRAALEEQDEMSNMPGMKTLVKSGGSGGVECCCQVGFAR
jgi:hypothetical protein